MEKTKSALNEGFKASDWILAKGSLRFVVAAILSLTEWLTVMSQIVGIFCQTSKLHYILTDHIN